MVARPEAQGMHVGASRQALVTTSMQASAPLRHSFGTDLGGNDVPLTHRDPEGRDLLPITLGLAVLLALFGPTGTDAIQTINMFTATAGVLLMLLVVTPDGYHRAGWAQLGLQRAGFRYWPLALLAPMAVLVASYGAATLLGWCPGDSNPTPLSISPSIL